MFAENIGIILFAIVSSLALLQAIYQYYVFGAFAFRKKQQTPANATPGVSVVIAARNEIENLKENLPLILQQDYPNFEVIVINDGSWDKTDELIADWKITEPRLKLVNIDEELKKTEGKKFALTLGFKAAAKEILLLTDADCKPISNQWIKTMVQPYANSQISMVIGYSPYERKNNLLNLFIRFETLLTAMQMFGFALRKNAFMGVGRNLSYRKSLFFEQKGFSTHLHIPYGDDDLFVQQAANKTNVAVCSDFQAFVKSKPKNTWNDWIWQKTRHLSVGRDYKSFPKFWLRWFSFTHFLFWVLLIPLFWLVPYWWVLTLIGSRWLLHLPVVFVCFKKLKQRALVPLFPIMDILYLFYSIFFGARATFVKQKKW